MLNHFYSSLRLPSPPVGRPFIAINMISSLDGKVTVQGELKPGSLGGSFDRQTMNVIRNRFDAVLSGGNTLRSHPFYLGVPQEYEKDRVSRGLNPQPYTVCLTGSGRLDPDGPLFQNPPLPPIVLTSSSGAENLDPAIKQVSQVEVLPEGAGMLEISQLLLDKYNVHYLLVEGGPSVNYQFLQAGIVDQLFLTLAPRLVGARNEHSLAMGDEVLPQPNEISLLSAHPHENELYLRYQLVW